MADPVIATDVDSPVDVVASDEQADLAIDVDRWVELATAVLHEEGARGELTLTFVDRDEIAALNAEHMGAEGPTDVLSFPLDAVDSDDPVASAPVLLGDVVVCPGVAVNQAAEHAGTVDDELALLIVHGILHVLGHDHRAPDETAAMRAREIELLRAHHWRGPKPDGFRQEQPPR